MSSFKDKNRPVISAKGLHFGIVVSRFNRKVTDKLLSGAVRTLHASKASRVDLVDVPGAFEIPIALQKLARSRRYSALLALGAVIRGKTPHFDYVATQTSWGIMKVMLDERIPIAFAVLTTDNEKQALARTDKGKEAALVAIEMARKNG